MKNISEILNMIMSIENVSSDVKLLNILDVSASTLSNWRKRGTIPFDVLYKYCKKRGYILNDILDDDTNSSSDTVHEPRSQYGDPHDKIIQRLEEENRQLKNTIDIIQTMINKSHNKC
ncbi:MAG: helix-turn-helix domain-containing protein [Candidatus Marinimicrobia bacterium]|jgi:hypothetical protein|nr:helix-turn-helix domain containing protein [Candidatus Omnitrophota bacterium]MDD5061815.1 helix-turn-helix domain-containing protein [Candidatus Neomarinimicrobiota bacterium]